MHFLPVIFLALVIQTLWMKESGKKHNDQSHKSREFVEFGRNLGTILDHIAEFSKRRQLVVLTEKTEKQHRLYPLKNPINPNQIITNTVFPILDGFQIDVVQIHRDLKHIILLEKLLRLEFGAQLAAIAVHRLEHPYNPHLFLQLSQDLINFAALFMTSLRSFIPLARSDRSFDRSTLSR